MGIGLFRCCQVCGLGSPGFLCHALRSAVIRGDVDAAQYRLRRTEAQNVYRVAQRFTGEQVADLLEVLKAQRGLPQAIRVDHGPEFISLALDQWAYWNCKHPLK